MTLNKNKQMPNNQKKQIAEMAEMQRKAIAQKQAIFEESAFLKALWELNHYRRQLGMESQHLAEKIKTAVDDVLEELGPFNDEQKKRAYERIGFTDSDHMEMNPEPSESKKAKIEIVR